MAVPTVIGYEGAMVFSSILFLFGFLPIFYLVYYALSRGPGAARRQNAWVLIASAAFYAWGAPRFLPIALLTSFVDYRASLRIGNSSTSESERRWLLRLTIAMNVGILVYFKYSNFFVAQVNEMLDHFGVDPFVWLDVALPIGISFITFEKISYLVDVAKKRVEPAPSFPTYLLFLALFPHLIAGPIFRYHDISEQLIARTLSRAGILSGIERLTLGLAKKILIADPLAAVVARVFDLPLTDLTPQYAWLGAFAYAFQIYFDFSGYSDMAIGLGRMMGFHFLENFDRPYISESITEFWRRWHISLSNWMKEYLYIPLGGSRGPAWRTYCNLWVVFLISGFWHGANWTFLFWGFYHGLFLVLERLGLGEALRRVPKPFRIGYAFLVVLIGWVPFRSDSMRSAWNFIGRMFLPFTGGKSVDGPLFIEVIDNRQLSVLVFAAAACFLPALFPYVVSRWKELRERSWAGAVSGVAALALLYLSTLSLVNSRFHPFIYFRF